MPIKITRTSLTIATAVLTFFGFLDATYLTIIHFKHIIPPCSFSGGCEAVLNSQYATIGPIPIALIGSLYYVALGVTLLLAYQTHKKIFVWSLFALTSASLLISIALVLIQAELLHMFCQYCLTVETINGLIWILSLIQTVVKRYRHQEIPNF